MNDTYNKPLNNSYKHLIYN